MKKMYIYIRQGNNVYLDDKLIGKFNNFDLAWTFASQLSQLIESQAFYEANGFTFTDKGYRLDLHSK